MKLQRDAHTTGSTRAIVREGAIRSLHQRMTQDLQFRDYVSHAARPTSAPSLSWPSSMIRPPTSSVKSKFVSPNRLADAAAH